MDRRDPPEAAQARADAAAEQLNEAIERRDGIVAQLREIDREREALINEMRRVMMQANDEEERGMERAIQRGNRFLEMQRELERAGREIVDENEEFARREREGAVNGMGRDDIPGNERARAEAAPEAELNRILERQNRLLQLQQEIEREIPVMWADNEPGRQILRPEHQVWVDPDEVNVEIEDVQPIPEERPNRPFPLLRIDRQPPVGLGARMQLMNRIRRENIEAAREGARLGRERERAMMAFELDNGEEGRQQRRPIGIPFEVVNRPPPAFPDLREAERNGYLERIREDERERRRRWRAARERAREEDREEMRREEIMEEVDAVGDEEDEAQQVQALQGLGGRLLDLLREMVEAQAANRRGGEAGGQGDRPAVSEEMIREAQRMRAEDINHESSIRYSRACSVCTIENPQTRAVYSRCGHIVCFPCAVDNATRGASGGKCVFCRQQSGFVKLFEEEYCIEKKKEENRSIMRTVIEYGKIMGGRIHSLISHPLPWAIARDVTCIGLAVVMYRKAPPNARIFVGAQLIALANLSLALRLKQIK